MCYIKSKNSKVKVDNPTPTPVDQPIYSCYACNSVQISKCKHCFQPIKIGEQTIYATASMDLEARPDPDLGIYLSGYSWSKLFETPEVFGELEGFAPAPRASNYPAIIVDWTDSNMLNYLTLRWLVDGIIVNMKNGKLIEIGCVGGHGRTGTLIACVLGKVENLNAYRAITSLRKRYCEEAVETVSQIRGVADFLNSPYPVGLKLSKKNNKKDPIIYRQGTN